MSSLDPLRLGRWIASRKHIWQMELLDVRDLGTFVRDRGLTMDREEIKSAWLLGLLRADLVVSETSIAKPGLSPVGGDEYGNFFYADVRRTPIRESGWANAQLKWRRLPQGVTPLFHPFRYYVLQQLERVLSFSVSPTQMIWSTQGFARLVAMATQQFTRSSRSRQFSARVDELNDIAALVVAVEPYVYERLFSSLKTPADIEFAEQRRHIANH